MDGGDISGLFIYLGLMFAFIYLKPSPALRPRVTSSVW